MNGKVGGAFVAYSNGIEIFSKSFRLSDNATVYSAELTAIKLAIKYATGDNGSKSITCQSVYYTDLSIYCYLFFGALPPRGPGRATCLTPLGPLNAIE
ncbi:hypothetical protein CDAR_276591 [Caerostris darwini]|uniref:RNase H type-1 domain-containing protein n=1 Tax=Caerostris darwini TaxID=1538125 RepID=A0AAV4MZH1_9ARAC|nr:hypothetical protein CDAR_276591 [Caerostris darwini]